MSTKLILFVCCLAAGALLAGGCAELKKPGPNPVTARSTVHPAGWSDTASTDFHGLALKARGYDPSSCASCHGGSYTGGVSGVACFTCHPSVPHQAQFAAPGGHVAYLKTKLFPLGECKACHGASYAGGVRVSVSCMSSGCHATAAGAPKTPEACNTCHGSFRAALADTATFAPPRALSGDTTMTTRGVGAHQPHLRGTAQLASPVPCAGCHQVPSSVFASGHMDTPPPAEVRFGTLARTPSSGLVPAPAYDAATRTCAGTYCHGSFRLTKASAPSSYQFVFSADTMKGGGAAPVWNAPGTATCGTCHALPPQGHQNFAPVSQCGDCHLGVVDNSFHILNKTLHINGKINVFNQEFSY